VVEMGVKSPDYASFQPPHPSTITKSVSRSKSWTPAARGAGGFTASSNDALARRYRAILDPGQPIALDVGTAGRGEVASVVAP
jgi:hypothetical protein